MTVKDPDAEAGPRLDQLFLVLLKRDVVVRTSGTYLGGIWTLLQPALQVFLFWYLFVVVMRVQSTGPVSFISYFITGMLPWILISDAITRNLSVMREFSVLFRRSIFPVKILPLLPLLTAMISYGVVFIAAGAIFGGMRGIAGAAVFTALLCLWLVPFCYLISVLGLMVQDAAHAAPILLSVVLYTTPILYFPEMVPARLMPWLALNPVADLMALDHALLQGMPCSLGNALRPAALWIIVAVWARRLFRRLEPNIREML